MYRNEMAESQNEITALAFDRIPLIINNLYFQTVGTIIAVYGMSTNRVKMILALI
jgi:hypothetical protein